MPPVRDGDGDEWEVSPQTLEHIQTFHPEFAGMSDIEWVLQDPDVKVRSNWELDTVL